nr:efflux RND transporter periplasmic adaptor subunit [Calothrix rhizosoleniae]
MLVSDYLFVLQKIKIYKVMQESTPSDTTVENQTDNFRENNETDVIENTPEPERPPKSWLWTLLIISVAINGVTLWQMFSSTLQTSEPVAVAAKAPPPKAVKVTNLNSGNTRQKIQLLGQVESPQQATIRSQTEGVIKQVLMQAGDQVSPGKLIAVIDDTDQKLALTQAQAQLAQQRNQLARLEVGTRPEIIAQRQATVSSAQAREREAIDNLERRTELVKQGAIAERLLVEARTAVDDARGARLAAEAELAEAKAGPTREEIAAQQANVAAAIASVNQAKLALDRTRIRAVSGGVVSQRKVSPGDYVESNSEIVNLIAGDRLDIFLELPEKISGQVTPGMRVELIARALPQWRENATISGVVPSADTASRRQRVRIRLDTPPSGLLPGMAVTGNLELGNQNQGLVVSRDALTRRGNQWLVFAVEDGKAKKITVEMIADMGEKVAISGTGLQPGQSVVLQGGDGLKDGAAVKLVDG